MLKTTLGMGLGLILLSTVAAWSGTPFGGDESGWAPPDVPSGPTTRCETSVVKNLSRFSDCTSKCHIRLALEKFAPGGEESCEGDCLSKYDKQASVILGKPGGCPPCLAASPQVGLAGHVLNQLETANGMTYCAGSTPFGGDDTGFVPPDLPHGATARCEISVAMNLSRLSECVSKCHVRLGLGEFAPGGEDSCDGDCEFKYLKQASLILGKPGGCPPCITGSPQESLGLQLMTQLDARNGSIYCASPSGAFIDGIGEF